MFNQSAFTRIEIALSLLLAVICIFMTAALVRPPEKVGPPPVQREVDFGETYIDLEYEVDEEGVSLAPVRARDLAKRRKAPAESLSKTNAAPSVAGTGPVKGKPVVTGREELSAKSDSAAAKPKNAKAVVEKKPGKTAKQPAGVGKSDVINIPPELAKKLDEIEQMEWSRTAEVKLLNVVRDWGRKYPEEALEYALSIERKGTRNSAVGGVLASWAKEDPDAAYEWFKTESAADPYYLEGQTRSLFNRLAARNVSDALSKVWELPSEDMKRMALGTVAGRMISLGRERDVLSLYNRLDGDADKKLVFDVVLQSMGRYEPVYLGRWVSAMEDKGARSKGLDVLMSVWANDHPRSAAEWVSSELAADADRARQISRVTGAWVKESPSEAADWLLSLFPPSSQTDAAVGTFSRAVLAENPGYAGTWSFAVTHPNQRWRLMEEVGTAWLKKDRVKAVEFIQSTDLPPATKSRLLK